MQKPKKKIKVYNPNNLPVTDYNNFKDLQGDLKILIEENLNKLKQSIIENGFIVPVFVWKNNNILYAMDGHQRKKALISLESEGYEIPKIPYLEIKANNKKDAGKKLLQINSKYGIINNETTFFEDFDIDFSYLDNIEIPELDDMNFDINNVDFGEGKTEDDEIPEVEEVICKKDDLWLLGGKHRLLCGDATKKEDVERLMNGEKADMVFTDPPYGMNVDTDYSKMSGNGRKGKKWDKVIGDDSEFNPIPLMQLFNNVNEQFWWGADYYAERIPNKNKGSFCVWDKTLKANNDAGYNSEFEIVWSKQPHKREIIHKEWFRFFGLQTQDTNERIHPTQKPIEVIIEIFKYCQENGLVIDPFLGSGSTLIACEKTNRKCFGLEIDEKYCDVIINRWEQYTGEKAEKIG